MALFHSERGSVDYTIVGSPTIVDGVASGFSSSNYLTLTTIPQGSSIEFNFRFTPTETLTGTFFRLGSSAYRGILEWLGNNTNVMRFSYREIGSTTTKYKSFDVPLNVPINYNMMFNSSTNTLVSTITSNNTTKVITTANVDGEEFTSTAMLGYVGSNRTSLNGTIDLNHTYITVNGQPWFGICPIEVKKHQLMGPVGYTVVGSPTITDGVVSGTDSSNYCSVNVNIPSFNTLEVVMRAKFTGTINSSAYMPLLAFGGGASQRRITSNFTTASNGGTRLFSADGLIVNIPNTDFDLNTYALDFYYTRIRVTKNTDDYTYELGVSADGTTWVTKSGNYASNICTGFFYLCRNSSGSSGGNVYCDLNNTYIKVNGKLWFWQPRETEKIVVNGVQVWQKPS